MTSIELLELGHVERTLEVMLHPVDQGGKRRIGRDLGLQQRAELRLITRPAGIEHEVAGDLVGHDSAEDAAAGVACLDDHGFAEIGFGLVSGWARRRA